MEIGGHTYLFAKDTKDKHDIITYIQIMGSFDCHNAPEKARSQ